MAADERIDSVDNTYKALKDLINFVTAHSQPTFDVIDQVYQYILKTQPFREALNNPPCFTPATKITPLLYITGTMNNKQVFSR